MSGDDSVRLDTRLAGQLHRYHTWPIVGQQTIAEHTWNLLRIYFCVTDKIDPHMVYHITFHDIGEHFTGDVPFPVKRDNPHLKEHMDLIEERSRLIQLDHWNCFKQVVLTNPEKALFKQIELTEMAEFGLDQMNLGNAHGFVIADRCLKAVYENQPCVKLCTYVIKRLNLFRLQYHGATEHFHEWWDVNTWRHLHGNGKSDSSGRDPL